MRLLVIDGNSIANRAFYGIKLLTTKDGRYTNAIFGFLNILLSLLKESEPDEVAVAFDLKAPTFRHKMYDGYKATRHKMPDELAAQLPVIRQLLALLGYREVTAEGWEADDILGTLAAACAARSDDCFLATGDRDSLQLVSDTTTVLLATTALGRSKTVTMDVDAVKEKYGVTPRQLIDVKSLMGDTSDNIPGVKGIGEKSAFTLIQKYGSLEGVYAHLDDTTDKTIKPKQREHLAEDRAMAELSYTLGTIRTDAPIDTAEGAYAVGEGNKAQRYFKERGIKFQMIDLKEKEMSRGEFENVSRALGGWQALVDPNAKDKQTLALLDALVDWQKEDKLFENQQLFRTPIVRNGRQATVGYQPDVWKNWE